MDRLQVIALAAAQLRAEHAAHDRRGLSLVRQVCAQASLTLHTDGTGKVLGGAHARLELFVPEIPSAGGFIWHGTEMTDDALAFAVAHELGHYALHRGEGVVLHDACGPSQINPQHDADDLRDRNGANGKVEEYTPRARREREANTFAAELLMPRDQVRRAFVADPACDVAWLADHFGVTPQLAQRRLIDAVLTADQFPSAHAGAGDARSATPTPTEAPPLTDDERRARAQELLAQLNDSQRDATTAAGPALVVAGPGTGKTATLIGRVAHLTEIVGAQPEQVLALTYSNRAAGEIRERLNTVGLRGERLPVMTIHAFAAMLLRGYASRVPHAPEEPPLTADFRILDATDSRLLLEELLTTFRLRHYRSMYDPTKKLGTLANDFSRARDRLLTPAMYLAAVDAMPIAPTVSAAHELAAVAVGVSGANTTTRGKRATPKAKPAPPPPGTYHAKDVAMARERALAYGVWDQALRQRGLLDYGGLILRAVELLRADRATREEAQRQFRFILVDEFQDTNYAAAELLTLIAGAAGNGLWVVGDPNQAIYRWRGADTQNLSHLATSYPHLREYTLQRCYRSTPDLVRLGVNLATAMNTASSGDNAVNLTTFAPRSSPVGEGRVGVVPTPQTSPAATHLAPNTPHLPPAGEGPGVGAVAITPVRGPTSAPSVARGEGLPSAQHEAAALALAIERQCELGVAYRDQAILCRTNAQVNALAQALTILGVPVAEAGDFFAHEEVKDALAFLALGAGPDGAGLLRGRQLLAALGLPAIPAAELARVTRVFAERGLPLPGALTELANLALAEITPPTQRALIALGAVADAVFHDYERMGVGARLAQFLLRPGGYAWALARRADAGGADGERACGQLAALGELTRLAFGFDIRWRNEPGFRRQVMRGAQRVTKRPAPIPALPDAREGSPTADVADIALPTAESRDTSYGMRQGVADGDVGSAPAEADVAGGEQDELGEWAPTARCFLRYLDVVRRSESRIPVVAAQDDAVAMLTIHGSKGLEFPVVYLPYLAKGKFPGNRRPAPVEPPAFRAADAADAADERDLEDRCLFYVGVTRARDLVAFTYGGKKKGKKVGGKRGADEPLDPSPLLALLRNDPSYQSAPSLLDAAQWAQLDERAATLCAALAATYGLPDDEDDGDAAADDGDDDGSSEPTSSAPIVAVKPVYAFYELDHYHECPRRYRYAAQYHLLGAAQQATLRFHRYVRKGLAELDDLYAQRPGATVAEVGATLAANWQTDGLTGLPHDELYRRYGEDVLRHQWQTLTADAQPPRRAAEKQTLAVELRECVVNVTADYLIEDDAPAPGAAVGGAAPTRQRVILERLHTRGPNATDPIDLDLMLYYLAFQGRPGVDVRIRIRYLGASLAEVDALSEDGDGSQPDATFAAAAEQSSVVDVTEKIAHDVGQYLAGKRSRLARLDRAARAIAAGQFAPRPNPQRCGACPFHNVCPADPEIE